MHKQQLYGPATIGATACGIAFVALIIISPIILNDIAQMEEELMSHREEYRIMSNNIWHYLMEQSVQLSLTRSARRIRRQYGAVDGYETRRDIERTESVVKGYGDGAEHQNSCPRGPTGPPGEPGERGENGGDGLPGKDGVSGFYYESPKDGPCAPCPPGPPGLPGYKGKRGPRGPLGKKGEPGMPGRSGAAGEEGPDGDIGQPGPDGPPGEKGQPGQDGYQYTPGPPGKKGEPGPKGAEGDHGAPGERGDEGETGPPGEPGRCGPDGPQGPKGIPGSIGQPGLAGADAEYCPCPARDAKGNGYDQVVGDGNGPTHAYRQIVPEKQLYDVTRTTDHPPGIRPQNGEEGDGLGDTYFGTTKKQDEAETVQPYKKRALAASLRRRH